jgi:hypothetical protein
MVAQHQIFKFFIPLQKSKALECFTLAEELCGERRSAFAVAEISVNQFITG